MSRLKVSAIARASGWPPYAAERNLGTDGATEKEARGTERGRERWSRKSRGKSRIEMARARKRRIERERGGGVISRE